MLQRLLLLTSVLAISPGQTGTAVDASAVRVGAPATVTELDLGKMKGDLRQVGWSPDGSQLYLQTAEGDPDTPKLRTLSSPSRADPRPRSTESLTGRPTTGAFKSDRFAPACGR